MYPPNRGRGGGPAVGGGPTAGRGPGVKLMISNLDYGVSTGDIKVAKLDVCYKYMLFVAVID